MYKYFSFILFRNTFTFLSIIVLTNKGASEQLLFLQGSTEACLSAETLFGTEVIEATEEMDPSFSVGGLKRVESVSEVTRSVKVDISCLHDSVRSTQDNHQMRGY